MSIYVISVIPEPACKIELEPCVICKRTFVPATLEKHIGICHKMQMRKRAVFDSSQMRREGTELEKYIPPPPVHTSPAGLHKWLDSRVSPPRQVTSLLLYFICIKFVSFSVDYQTDEKSFRNQVAIYTVFGSSGSQ